MAESSRDAALRALGSDAPKPWHKQPEQSGPDDGVSTHRRHIADILGTVATSGSSDKDVVQSYLTPSDMPKSPLPADRGESPAEKLHSIANGD